MRLKSSTIAPRTNWRIQSTKPIHFILQNLKKNWWLMTTWKTSSSKWLKHRCFIIDINLANLTLGIAMVWLTMMTRVMEQMRPKPRQKPSWLVIKVKVLNYLRSMNLGLTWISFVMSHLCQASTLWPQFLRTVWSNSGTYLTSTGNTQRLLPPTTSRWCHISLYEGILGPFCAQPAS